MTKTASERRDPQIIIAEATRLIAKMWKRIKAARKDVRRMNTFMRPG